MKCIGTELPRTPTRAEKALERILDPEDREVQPWRWLLVDVFNELADDLTFRISVATWDDGRIAFTLTPVPLEGERPPVSGA